MATTGAGVATPCCKAKPARPPPLLRRPLVMAWLLLLLLAALAAPLPLLLSPAAMVPAPDRAIVVSTTSGDMRG